MCTALALAVPKESFHGPKADMVLCPSARLSTSWKARAPGACQMAEMTAKLYTPPATLKPIACSFTGPSRCVKVSKITGAALLSVYCMQKISSEPDAMHASPARTPCSVGWCKGHDSLYVCPRCSSLETTWQPMLWASGLPSTHLTRAFWASPAASTVSPIATSLCCEMCLPVTLDPPFIQHCCCCPIAGAVRLESHQF